MSRSYKKAIYKDPANTLGKKYANRAVRRAKDVPNGGSYTKVYETYSVCDYIIDLRFWREIPHRGAKWTGKGWVVPK